jgi:predicted nucleotidyltransferase
MKTVQATALRRELFETLKRLAYEREPVLIERRGKTIAALIPADLVGSTQDKTGHSGRLGAKADNEGTARPTLDPRAIGDFCAKYKIKTLYLFGSILTDQFDSESDVDVMFVPDGPPPSYFQQMDMTDDLEALFCRPVDLVSRNAVESSSNPFRKKAIMKGAQIIYAR